MKIRNKILIATTATCLIFLALAYFSVIHGSLLYFIPIVILFSLSICALIQYLVISRIKILNTQLNTDFKLNESTKNTDEIACLENQINELITTFSLENFTQDENRNFIADVNKDNVTSLPNRNYFNDALNKAISLARRKNKTLAMLLVDLDAFHDTNKILGQSFGNFVLNEIGKRLTKALRVEDIVAKLDADEFIVLLSDIGKPKFAGLVAQKLLSVCSQPIEDIFTTVSIGISIFPHDGNSLEDLLSHADSALYQAKHAGGNKYQFYTQEMDAEAREFIELEKALHQSITNKELVLYYQPKLNIKKGSITGVEALVRWEHPKLGILHPAQFIPIAEDTGFIVEIGKWALFEACKTNKYWQDEGYEHLTVSLNLSPKQFQDSSTPKIIHDVLKETGLNPKYLELEINEATVMDNIDIALSQLEHIKQTGIQLSIDHFGAGYTSISHLKKFPICAIKIDHNYIKGIPNNPNDSAITNAFIALAHNLGFEVVAEGVETAEQVQFLTLQNCDMIQGYFLSHPLPAQKIVHQFKKLMDRTIF